MFRLSRLAPPNLPARSRPSEENPAQRLKLKPPKHLTPRHDPALHRFGAAFVLRPARVVVQYGVCRQGPTVRPCQTRSCVRTGRDRGKSSVGRSGAVGPRRCVWPSTRCARRAVSRTSSARCSPCGSATGVKNWNWPIRERRKKYKHEHTLKLDNDQTNIYQLLQSDLLKVPK